MIVIVLNIVRYKSKSKFKELQIFICQKLTLLHTFLNLQFSFEHNFKNRLYIFIITG